MFDVKTRIHGNFELIPEHSEIPPTERLLLITGDPEIAEKVRNTIMRKFPLTSVFVMCEPVKYIRILVSTAWSGRVPDDTYNEMLDVVDTIIACHIEKVSCTGSAAIS